MCQQNFHTLRTVDLHFECVHVRPVHRGETLREEGTRTEGDGDGEKHAGPEGREFTQGGLQPH